MFPPPPCPSDALDGSWPSQAHPCAFIVPKHRNCTLQTGEGNQPTPASTARWSWGLNAPNWLSLGRPLPSPNHREGSKPRNRRCPAENREEVEQREKKHTKPGLFVPPTVQRSPEPAGRAEVVFPFREGDFPKSGMGRGKLWLNQNKAKKHRRGGFQIPTLGTLQNEENTAEVGFSQPRRGFNYNSFLHHSLQISPPSLWAKYI